MTCSKLLIFLFQLSQPNFVRPCFQIWVMYIGVVRVLGGKWPIKKEMKVVVRMPPGEFLGLHRFLVSDIRGFYSWGDGPLSPGFAQ